jgi:hypothetical protein
METDNFNTDERGILLDELALANSKIEKITQARQTDKNKYMLNLRRLTVLFLLVVAGLLVVLAFAAA